MIKNSKAIASSILMMTGIAGTCIALIGNNSNVYLPIIVGIIGALLLRKTWTGSSLEKRFKNGIAWIKGYDNLEKRMLDAEKYSTQTPINYPTRKTPSSSVATNRSKSTSKYQARASSGRRSKLVKSSQARTSSKRLTKTKGRKLSLSKSRVISIAEPIANPSKETKKPTAKATKKVVKKPTTKATKKPTAKATKKPTAPSLRPLRSWQRKLPIRSAQSLKRLRKKALNK